MLRPGDDNMKRSAWKPYAFWILFTEAVGALSGWLTREGTALYQQEAIKPPLSPPGAVFPIVWSILFLLMGIGAARVWRSPRSGRRSLAIGIYLLQLAFNFFWSILFFNLQAYLFAFLWLVILWGLILWMILTFRQVDPPAGYLQIPYLLWVSFAAYLNLATWLLNR